MRLPACPRRPGAALVVFVHGGFWRAAYDRQHTGPLAAALAARGYPVAAVEYRRIGQPGGGWPGTLSDVAAAVAAVPELAAEPRCPDGPCTSRGRCWSGTRPAVTWRCTPRPRPGRRAAACSRWPRSPTWSWRTGWASTTGAVAALLGGGPADVPGPVRRGRSTAVGADATTDRDRPRLGDQQVPVGDAPVLRRRRRGAPAIRHPFSNCPGCEHFGLIDPSSAAWPPVLDALRSLQMINRPIDAASQSR